jgi:cell division protein FtsQ
VVLFCAVLIAIQLAQDPQRFPVSNVDILGTVDYADRDALQQAVATHMDKGFYGLDIDDVRQSVERLPWIAHARVSRIWPGRIEVHVEEHEPSARWNDDKLLSKRQVLFAPPQLQLDNPRYSQWHEVFAGLPQVRGSEGRHSELLDAYRAHERDLGVLGLSLTELDEDERGSRTLVLSNGVTVRLGYAEQELRMQRFLDVYTRMAVKIEAQNSLSSAAFDMRYSNGFALGGVPGEEERATNELRVESLELPTRTAEAFAMKRES